jgi:hypothetical protein
VGIGFTLVEEKCRATMRCRLRYCHRWSAYGDNFVQRSQLIRSVSKVGGGLSARRIAAIVIMPCSPQKSIT